METCLSLVQQGLSKPGMQTTGSSHSRLPGVPQRSCLCLSTAQGRPACHPRMPFWTGHLPGSEPCSPGRSSPELLLGGRSAAGGTETESTLSSPRDVTRRPWSSRGPFRGLGFPGLRESKLLLLPDTSPPPPAHRAGASSGRRESTPSGLPSLPLAGSDSPAEPDSCILK